MSVLKVTGLKKSYKKGFIPKRVEVLKGVDFEVRSSTITGFLGGNGAGKTTTMKCIFDLCLPDEGEILFFGDQKLTSEVKKRIGFLPEHPYFYDYLTGVEFLLFYGQISTDLKKSLLKEKALNLLKRVNLLHAKDKKLRDYSKGMKQKLGLAQALIHDPEFVVLDEPMSGLDPDGRYAISEIIREVAAKGTAVFLSSHLLPDVERLCDKLIILKNGVVNFQGDMNEYLSKLGGQYWVSFLDQSKKQLIEYDSQESLQVGLKSILDQGGVVLEVSHKSSLEAAFIKFGLNEKAEL